MPRAGGCPVVRCLKTGGSALQRAVTFWKIGHRGAAGTRPELTRSSFERAIELGADMVELDVQLTRDDRLVVLHDRDLGRTVTASGPVRDALLDDLRGLDAGTWFAPTFSGERVLSLEEVLDLTRDRIDLNVEIKSPAPDWPETARVLVPLLREQGRLPSTIVSSFDVGALRCVRSLRQDVRIGVLCGPAELDAAWSAVAELGAAAIHPHWSVVSRDVVAQAHRAGVLLFSWTVNEVALIRRLAGFGVDGIISDFPERLAGISAGG